MAAAPYVHYAAMTPGVEGIQANNANISVGHFFASALHSNTGYEQTRLQTYTHDARSLACTCARVCTLYHASTYVCMRTRASAHSQAQAQAQAQPQAQAQAQAHAHAHAHAPPQLHHTHTHTPSPLPTHSHIQGSMQHCRITFGMHYLCGSELSPSLARVSDTTDIYLARRQDTNTCRAHVFPGHREPRRVGANARGLAFFPQLLSFVTPYLHSLFLQWTS